MNSRDLLAKLLANENLNIVRAPVSTASMDIRSRTLTLPQWKEMTPAVEEMLIGHEVGHAIFTTNDYIKEGESRALHSYMNVIEDVRIEKKIKNKYPGLRSSFIKGYKELNDRDFFEIRGLDLTGLLLIDRINLYYKVGFNCGVKFTPVEMEFIRRTDKCDTINDVYLLAKDLLEFTKQDRETKKQLTLSDLNFDELTDEDIEDMKNAGDVDGYDDSDEDSDEESDNNSDSESDSEETESPDNSTDNNTSKSEPDTDQELESRTERSLRNRLDALADTDTNVTILTPELKSTSNNEYIIGYKTILSELESQIKVYETNTQNYTSYEERQYLHYKAKTDSDVTKFNSSAVRVVNYLLKEFEMKKSATSYKRSKTSKSGEIDVKKLYAFKLTDDVFKRITVVPDAKNHGMVFLLDWSGSMSEVMFDTVKQVITLAMFCSRAQIPYQVFAFASFHSHTSERDLPISEDYTGFVGNFSLFELYSSKMTKVEFTRMTAVLFNRPWLWSEKYSLQATPLNEGLCFMTNYLGEFIKKNNLEKTTFITLTDGEGHSITAANGTLRSYTYQRDKTVRNITYIRDPITRREYPINGNGPSQTKTFLSIIKDRYNIKTVGFHVIRNSTNDMTQFVRANVLTENELGASSMAKDLKQKMREQNFALVPNTGRDEMYLLPSSKIAMIDDALKVTTDMNSRQIAKQFTKFLDVQKTSRVLLSRFIKLIA